MPPQQAGPQQTRKLSADSQTGLEAEEASPDSRRVPANPEAHEEDTQFSFEVTTVHVVCYAAVANGCSFCLRALPTREKGGQPLVDVKISWAITSPQVRWQLETSV